MSQSDPQRADLPVVVGPPEARPQDPGNRFRLAVCLLCGAAFLGQVGLPFVIKRVMTPVGALGGVEVEAQQVNNAAAWAGRVWYVRNVASGYDGNRTQLVSLSLSGESDPRVEGTLPMIEPWMLAGEDRLWILSKDEMVTYRDGQVEVVAEGMKLTDVSRPFLYNGCPALLDLHSMGYTLLVWRDGQWRRERDLDLAVEGRTLSATGEALQVVADEGELHVFCRPAGEAIRYRHGLDGDEWETVADLGFLQQWKAAVIDGVPHVFYHDDRRSGGPYITGLRREAGQWRAFLHYRVGADIGLGAVPGEGGTDVVLLRRILPLRVEAIGVSGGQPVWTSGESGGLGLSARYRFWSMVPRVVPPLLAGLLAVVLTPVLASLKPSRYEQGGRRVTFASPLRRGIAAAIDTAILLGPLAAWGYTEVSALQANFSLGALFSMLGSMLCMGTLWLLIAFVTVSLLEGLWGRTPGKWLAGIRVVRFDLARPGFGWAALRNLIRPVDMIQWYVLGLLLVGLTQRWQRLGDLAAGTLVIQEKGKDTTHDRGAGTRSV